MDFNKIVETIINGTITDDELAKLIRNKFLLNEYNGKPIIDYILYHKRNTIEFDKYSVYDATIAKKYLEYGLKPYIDSEEILLSKYEDGKTIFEKYIEQNLSGPPISGLIPNLLADGRNLKEVLMYKLGRGKTIFEVLEEQHLNLDINYIVLANDMRTFSALINNGQEQLTSYVHKVSYLFSIHNRSGEQAFDVALRNLGVDYNDLDSIKSSIQMGNFDNIPKRYFEKINEKEPVWFSTFVGLNFDKCTSDIEQQINLLLSPISGTLTFLDLCLTSLDYDFGYGLRKIHELANREPRLAPFYVKHGKWSELANASCEVWNTEVDGKTVVEYLIDRLSNTFVIETPGFLEKFAIISKENVGLAELAYNCRMWSLALSCESFLFNHSSQTGNLNLEDIIKQLKLSNELYLLGESFYTEKFLVYRSDRLNNQTILEFLIENNCFSMQNVSSDLLLGKIDSGKTILEFILEKNRNLVEEWLKGKNVVLDNRQVVDILYRNGIFVPTNNLQAFEMFKNRYIRQIFLDRSSGKIDEQSEALINEFRTLMLDGNSDKEIVDLACASFKEQLASDGKAKIYALRDLQNLIQIKKEKRYLSFKKSEYTRFNETNYIIDIADIYDIDGFNHELGHLLHHWCTKFSRPDLIDGMIKQFNPNAISDVLQRNQREYLKQNMNQFFKGLDSIAESSSLRELYDNLKKQFVNYAHINECNASEGYLLNQPLSFEEFKSVFNNICVKEMIQKEFVVSGRGIWTNLTGIFDALSKGRLSDITSGKLLGHGADYYNENNNIHPFDEMIASYVAIIKSPKREEMLQILTRLTSQEFISLLDEYYDNFTYETHLQTEADYYRTCYPTYEFD